MAGFIRGLTVGRIMQTDSSAGFTRLLKTSAFRIFLNSPLLMTLQQFPVLQRRLPEYPLNNSRTFSSSRGRQLLRPYPV